MDEARETVDAFPDARLEPIPDAGHSSNLENPDAANAAIREFLQEVYRVGRRSSPLTVLEPIERTRNTAPGGRQRRLESWTPGPPRHAALRAPSHVPDT